MPNKRQTRQKNMLLQLSFPPRPTSDSTPRPPLLGGVTSDFTNFNKVSISSRAEDLAGISPFAISPSLYVLGGSRKTKYDMEITLVHISME